MLSKEYVEKIKQLCNELNDKGIECKVDPREFITYISAETYEEEQSTLEDILNNKYLLVHELVEITLLKNMGYEIDKNVIRRAYPNTYKAHLEAIDVELKIAMEEESYSWINKRLRDLVSYLSDPHLPTFLVDKVKQLLQKYSALIK